MRYGNCLIGLIVLAIKHRFKGRVVVLRNVDYWIPHLAWLTADGRVHEYTTVKDLLPGPFYWIVFQGEYRSRSLKKMFQESPWLRANHP